MRLVSAAERLAAIDRSEVTLDPSRCLHTLDRFSSCDRCYDVCPAEAILPGPPPTLNNEKCQSCLACLPTCPVGAYAGDDAVRPLLQCTARLEGRQLELLCELHPSAENGVSDEAVGIRIRGCLAGLGTGTYLALAGMGIPHIAIHLEACKECPWQSLVPHIQTQIARAKRLLSVWELADVLEPVTVPSDGKERPLWDAGNPPLTRRDLFRLAAMQGQMTIARAMSVDHLSGERQPGRDYQRMAYAIQHLLGASQPISDISMGEAGFASLSVSGECTACSACARACPTTALTLEMDEDESHYWLKFTPANCIGCEVCVHVCVPQALVPQHAPLFNQVFASKEALLLGEGALSRCERCNASFAARAGAHLCPTCDYRRRNPFGSKNPARSDIQRAPTGEVRHDH